MTDPSLTDRRPLDAVRSALAPLAHELHRVLPDALDGTDPEDLHRLRVAVRQTRTILRELDEVLPADRVAPARDLFASLAAATSEPRDLDVHLSEWELHLEPLAEDARRALAPVRVALEARTAHAHRQLRMVLGATATSRGLLAWSEWLEPEPGPPAELAVLATPINDRLQRLHERLLRDGRRITPASAGHDLHELRKRGKRLRYLIECFAPLFAVKERRVFLAHLKDLQDNLGAHQDAEMQGHYLRSLALEINDGSPAATDAVIAVGRLTETTGRRRAAERAAFADHFRQFDRPRTTRCFDELLASSGHHSTS